MVNRTHTCYVIIIGIWLTNFRFISLLSKGYGNHSAAVYQMSRARLSLMSLQLVWKKKIDQDISTQIGFKRVSINFSHETLCRRMKMEAILGSNLEKLAAMSLSDK